MNARAGNWSWWASRWCWARAALPPGGSCGERRYCFRSGIGRYCRWPDRCAGGRINFMATHGRGLICLAITPELAKRLSLSLINPGTHRQTGRPFARSIEAASGVSTGISAADRAHTVAVAIAPGSSAADIHSPGHVFPLIAQAGGVLARPSAVEASIELARLADAGDAAVICSIMRDDGEMARIDDIGDLLRDHGLAVADIGTLLARIESADAERA
ncbi:MAG: 3,4-dihydroxy-2-butanone 4-phosphate synthase [Alphaproteobacteria bacterium HGW-Alphaproteobacteria-7]|nr:MAG: 3,4-dihydroxy-2-butanone 4-phosphate synthase [Alphaproteobacteria bacterium HGW-Alphaproteobacteria-7]